MLRRVIFWLLLLALPVGVQAQTPDTLKWIPADFAGFVRLQVHATNTLTTLDLVNFVASFLQPTRVQFQQLQGLESVVPLTQLDVESVSFNTDILPWLADEVVIAYKQFGRNFTAGPDDMALILPTDKTLQAANSFSQIIQQQDKLQREEYRGETLYIGDKTTIVFAPEAVLIGPTDLVKAMLDVKAGDGDRMVDDPSYNAVAVADGKSQIVSGFIRGDVVLRGLSVLLERDESAVPILQELNQALEVYNKQAVLEKLVLGNQLDGIGFVFEADTLRLDFLRLRLMLHDAEYTDPVSTASFDSSVLDLIPQNAMVVQSGPDTVEALYDALIALPLVNFTGKFLAGFPIQQPTASASDSLDTPSTTDIEGVVGSFLSVLNQQGNFDFDHDLAQYFSGGYALALMPRPNDPLPTLNLPYDVLLVAHVDDPQAALAGATRLAQILLGVDSFDTSTVDGFDFSTLQPDPLEDPVLYIGTVDDLLVVATGRALSQALDARDGDNQLVSRARWQAVSDNSTPQFYLDIPAVYGTFLPDLAGPQLRQINQLGARTDYLGDGLFEINVMVTMPSQLG